VGIVIDIDMYTARDVDHDAISYFDQLPMAGAWYGHGSIDVYGRNPVSGVSCPY
jgi:hypothetical protein